MSIELCRRGFLKLGVGLAVATAWRSAHSEPASRGPRDFGPPPQFELVGDLLGTTLIYHTLETETLLDVARAFNLGYVEMINANRGVDHWLPGRNTAVTLPTGHLLPDAPRRGIVMNLADLRLYYFMKGGRTLSFAIGSGRDGYRSRRGATTVARKVVNPSWYPTADERRDNPDLPAVVPPGPDNPLGAYGMYLGWPRYIIHGTNMPWGIGRQISRGCFHCYPEGIDMLYPLVPIGTPVHVVNQTAKIGWSGGRLWLETSPNQDEIDAIEVNDPVTFKPISGLEQAVRKAAGNAAAAVDWPSVRQIADARTGVPMPITPLIVGRAEPDETTDVHSPHTHQPQTAARPPVAH
jgi:L,D-transpeptidase ErfK/SrfK